ncbi:DUF2268 domain-containing putative Zn-dependent protease [Virgibacillus halodenitrificans]|uniref:DUF2268 domain-containing protein n=1 Tax=Virgibacillus halodenitrificans TaxID=1482 RepID=UPI002DBE5200|nr:DUF2268 domain-containing protein [Virgibacillus halodenitrificans]MEC2160824.1 DUF2268 domain-containing protein [Virgibacillus halodenitrificans]
MGVVKTDKWLLDTHEEPVILCEKLTDLFTNVSAEDIYHHLSAYGMYTPPLPDGEELIKKLQKKGVWQTIQHEYKKLQSEWNGPEVPIFIFPSDPKNRRLKDDHNGKAGLTFKDKLFLFVSENNTEKELQALLTHEYNHVCRLSKVDRKEKDFTLLDTIILEGLAENAVRERLGEESIANWTTYYSELRLQKLWENLIFPKKNMKRTHSSYYSTLYGGAFHPKMAGYCVGYQLVKKYADNKKTTTKEMLDLPSEAFIPS